MKKAVSIFAVLVLSIGLFSCEAESTSETDALYDIQATDGDIIKSDGRD